MRSPRWIAATAFLALALTSAPKRSPAAAGADPVAALRPAVSELSVMTYNVKGLPFPIALARSDALMQIGQRLARLRQTGMQPHIIALQEAFTPEAKAIAALAGYRYVALGPQGDVPGRDPAQAMPPAFRSAAHWLKGETEGKWLDSGLVILSDYPIRRSLRMAFPSDACAGFDCLAAKGVLVAWIDVPGHAQPVAIADTHLNSRGASGVLVSRADAAFARQLDALRSFLQANVPARDPLVLAGDFNIGHIAQRQAAARKLDALLDPQDEATRAAEKAGQAHTSPDIAAILERAKDREFFRPGTRTPITFGAISVPFGQDNGASALSDHIGFITHYTLGNDPADKANTSS